REYQSKYRGRVQNRSVSIDFLPEYPITGFDSESGQSKLQKYADAVIDNREKRIEGQISIADITSLINQDPKNAVHYYTRGTLLARKKDYSEAIKDFTMAISLDPMMPEAYFNRGLCYIFTDRKSDGMADLSKAGELGLYSAYSVMKKFNNEKK
ncbi:MAG: tetratricopeptide repeat protein, partial [Prevotella sp.]|nr:tetratricopeptide repeat protein [Prevotella sp.]